MIAIPGGVRVWLAVGCTDMRRGMNSLALQVQQAFQRDPHGGDLYVFRGKRGDLYIRISVQIPEKLSKEAKKLVEELKKEGI